MGSITMGEHHPVAGPVDNRHDRPASLFRSDAEANSSKGRRRAIRDFILIRTPSSIEKPRQTFRQRSVDYRQVPPLRTLLKIRCNSLRQRQAECGGELEDVLVGAA